MNVTSDKKKVTIAKLTPDQRHERDVARRKAASERAAHKYSAELEALAERGAERQLQEDGIDYIEGKDTDGARRFAALLAERGDAVRASRQPAPSTTAHVRRAVTKAERTAGDGSEISGTGYTVLKMREKPLAYLINAGKIAMEEINAADEISAAFRALSIGLGAKGGLNIDRVDSGGIRSGHMPAGVMRAVRQYQTWANHWSRRAKTLCDPMLEVVVAAVIDERSFRQIAADVGRRHATIEQGVIAGLQDYAARAGLYGGRQAADIMVRAESVFVPPAVLLAKAVSRARFER